MKLKFVIMSFLFAFSAAAFACWNDSECPNDKVCECPSTSPTGNCSSAGQCVPDGRNWKVLKEELLRSKSIVSITNLNDKEIQKSGNTIETVTMKIEGKTGDPQPQYFNKKVNGNIIKIFDLKCNPSIGGVVSVSGVGTDMALVEVRASGYPGRFSSTCTFQVIH
jgi:hypothetical protein